MRSGARNSKGPRAFGRFARVAPVLALTAIAGLLLWSKLKMVANLPRTAYAEPRLTTQGDGEEPADRSSEGETPSDRDAPAPMAR